MSYIHSNYNYVESRFEYVIRVCAFTKIFDVFSLAQLNKNINNVIYHELLKRIEVPIEIVSNWTERKLDKYRNDIRQINDVFSIEDIYCVNK